MKITRQQSVYLAIAGVGLVALIADRLFFSPSSAEASASESEPVPAAHAPASAPDTPENTAVVPSLSERLAHANPAPWIESDVPDGFQPPASWLTEMMMGPPSPETTEPRTENTQAHKLTAVLLRGRPCAYIDRKPYSVGDALPDGMVLTSITEQGVELRGREGTVNLVLGTSR